jgi:hypothetical protein
VGAARIEADEVRTQAQQMLDEARAEVASLTTRRDEIAEELGRLSGVIEALSVPGAPAQRSSTNPAPNPESADVAR